MKIPAIDLESRVLLVAAAEVLLAVLRMAHLVQVPDSGDIGLLLVFAILLANFVASSRHAAAATALSFLCFELLCWTNPPSGNSLPAIVFHRVLLAFFGLGFTLYAFGAVYAWLRPGTEPVRRTLQMARDLPVPELSSVTVKAAH